MVDQRFAKLIAARLMGGLTHPGENGQALNIALPGFRTAGMAPEMAEQVEVTAKLIGEAIVGLIEEDAVIVAKKDYERLQTAAARERGGWARVVPVHCRCDRDKNDPLFMLTVTDDPAVVVDGKMMIRGLTRRGVECPHKVAL